MATGPVPRWELAASRARSSAPSWLDLDRVPWWLWALSGVGWACRGAYLLVVADSTGDVLLALGVLVAIAPSQLLVARRRQHGTAVFGALRS